MNVSFFKCQSCQLFCFIIQRSQRWFKWNIMRFFFFVLYIRIHWIFFLLLVWREKREKKNNMRKVPSFVLLTFHFIRWICKFIHNWFSDVIRKVNDRLLNLEGKTLVFKEHLIISVFISTLLILNTMCWSCFDEIGREKKMQVPGYCNNYSKLSFHFQLNCIFDPNHCEDLNDK